MFNLSIALGALAVDTLSTGSTLAIGARLVLLTLPLIGFSRDVGSTGAAPTR
ncbi:hypothetical protein ACIBI9_19105 [Nonomuraea sp. NPDC050451]|uniref:hypothetical protein n=1 Tax=Nonomuraea sp. NPDC050451 TaxID=3364364 RepID=UPI003796C231